MDSRTQLGNGLVKRVLLKSKTLETQNGSDQMSGILLMRTLDQSHNTEEKLHQSTNSKQANQDKELILSQADQVVLVPHSELKNSI